MRYISKIQAPRDERAAVAQKPNAVQIENGLVRTKVGYPEGPEQDIRQIFQLNFHFRNLQTSRGMRIVRAKAPEQLWYDLRYFTIYVEKNKGKVL